MKSKLLYITSYIFLNLSCYSIIKKAFIPLYFRICCYDTNTCDLRARSNSLTCSLFSLFCIVDLVDFPVKLEVSVLTPYLLLIFNFQIGLLSYLCIHWCLLLTRLRYAALLLQYFTTTEKKKAHVWFWQTHKWALDNYRCSRRPRQEWGRSWLQPTLQRPGKCLPA